jgi:hypothetical protein
MDIIQEKDLTSLMMNRRTLSELSLKTSMTQMALKRSLMSTMDRTTERLPSASLSNVTISLPTLPLQDTSTSKAQRLILP